MSLKEAKDRLTTEQTVYLDTFERSQITPRFLKESAGMTISSLTLNCGEITGGRCIILRKSFQVWGHLLSENDQLTTKEYLARVITLDHLQPEPYYI